MPFNRTFVMCLTLLAGTLSACGADEPAPAPPAPVGHGPTEQTQAPPATTKPPREKGNAAPSSAPTRRQEDLSTPEQEATPDQFGPENSPSDGGQNSDPQAQARCELMRDYEAQLNKLAHVDSLTSSTELQALAPEFLELKDIAEEIDAVGLDGRLGSTFVLVHIEMAKEAGKGNLQPFQSDIYMTPDIEAAFAEVSSWCD